MSKTVFNEVCELSSKLLNLTILLGQTELVIADRLRVFCVDSFPKFTIEKLPHLLPSLLPSSSSWKQKSYHLLGKVCLRAIYPFL